jgi:mono/diheme cytochrome c family protein
MTRDLLLGLFKEPTEAAQAIDGLRQLGVAEAEITVMSGVPYEPEVLARPRHKGRLVQISLLGALAGVLAALFLTVGTFELYPLIQGGQPLVPVPPSLIILFEITMLGTMGTVFLGFLVLNGFPVFGRPAYDQRITAGEIGVLAEMDQQVAAQAETAFREAGASDVRAFDQSHRVSRVSWWFFAATGAMLLLGATVTLLLFTYDVIRIPFPTQMAAQNSIGYEQGPRLAAPAQSVPIQGPALIAGQPASVPAPATADSLQRGQVLFSIHCALCHGTAGTGDGPLAKYFSPRPPDLTNGHVHTLPDDVLFLVITQGLGPMPGLAENLSPIERWDVINHVHSLGNGDE